MASTSESEISHRRRRVTYSQLEVLWEFLNSNKDVAMGYNKSTHAREHSKRMWETVSVHLNAQGEGAVKSWKEWCSYWVDYKSKIKKRAAAVRLSQAQTGGGPSNVPPLSEMEKKYLTLMGEDYGAGLPNIQVDPFAPRITVDSADVSQNSRLAPAEEEALVIWPTSQMASDDVQEVETTQVVALTQQEVPLQEVVQPLQQELPPPSVVDNPHRRRRRPIRRITQEEARHQLIDISRQKLETMQQMLVALNKIADKIDSIGGRETSDEGTSSSQPIT